METLSTATRAVTPSFLRQHSQYGQQQQQQQFHNNNDAAADADTDEWNAHLEQLRDYKKHHGDCNVPHCYPELGRWVGMQRVAYARKRLSKVREQQLEGIGFVWNPNQRRSHYASDNGRQEEEEEEEEEEDEEEDEHELQTQTHIHHYHHRRVSPSSSGLEEDDDDLEDNHQNHHILGSTHQYSSGGDEDDDDEEMSREENDGFSDDYIDSGSVAGSRGTKRRTKGKGPPQQTWHAKAVWDINFKELQKYKHEFGDCNVTRKEVDYAPLCNWITKQRRLKKLGKLTLEQERRLTNLGLEWDEAKLHKTWNERYDELLEYKNQNGHCNVPQTFKANPTLGKWVIGQRHLKHKGQLSNDRVRKLDRIGFIWSKKAMSDKELWEFRFQQLLDYRKEHGDCNVPTQNEENPQLGSWVGTQRAFRKNGRLSQIRQRRLDDIGFDWKANRNKLKHTDWNLRYEQLCAFCDEFGHCNVPRQYDPNPQLGLWVGTQRAFKKQNRLTADREQQLNAVGFLWGPQNGHEKPKWTLRFEELLEYKEKYGHCNVPQRFSPNPQLGHWVMRQRNSYSKKMLSNERKAKLDSIGFVWNPAKKNYYKLESRILDDDTEQYVRQERATPDGPYEERPKWLRRFSELQAYTETFGHANVPQRYPPNPKLGHWVMRQRNSHSKKNLSVERKKKLDSLGFVWNPSKSGMTKAMPSSEEDSPTKFGGTSSPIPQLTPSSSSVSSSF